MGQIKAVTIEVEVFVKESDEHFFALADWEKECLADIVESKLNSFKSEDYRNDWEVLGAQVKKIK